MKHITIYLDLSNAFEPLDHTVLLEQLQYYGVKGVALSLIKGVALSLIRDHLTKRKQ